MEKTLKVSEELHTNIKIFCAKNKLKINDWVEKKKKKILSDLELGTHNIKPTEIEGYKFVGEEIVEETEDEEEYEDYDEDELELDDEEYDEEIEEDDDEIEELEDDELDSIKKFVDGLSGKDGK